MFDTSLMQDIWTEPFDLVLIGVGISGEKVSEFLRHSILKLLVRQTRFFPV